MAQSCLADLQPLVALDIVGLDVDEGRGRREVGTGSNWSVLVLATAVLAECRPYRC